MVSTCMCSYFFKSLHMILNKDIIPEELHGRHKHHLNKGNQLAEQSIILVAEVGGRPSILLMKMVVITSIVVKFTLKAASKKKGLKKVVA